MSEETKRPTLRVVSPDEAPETPPLQPGPVVAQPSPSAEYTRLAHLTSESETDASVPINAAYLVCVGCRLAEAAVDFHHSAAAHAAPSVFRNGVPPGLRSAEATRTWLDTHLVQVRELANTAPGQPKAPYPRCRDLAEAVRIAGQELDRAHAVTKVAGLWFDERRAQLFTDAIEDLENVGAFVHARRDGELTVETEPIYSDSIYDIGCAVLGNFYREV